MLRHAATMEQARLYAEAGAKPLVAHAGPIQLARDKVVDALAGQKVMAAAKLIGQHCAPTRKAWPRGCPSRSPGGLLAKLVCQVLRVSVVSPGPVETPGFGKFRLTATVLHLASPESTFIVVRK
jgi:hypothetical protein